MRSRKMAGPTLIGSLLLLLMPSRAWADPGDLDLTFGEGGLVVTDFGTNDSALDVLVQPDGKIVAGGTSSGPGFALARYNKLDGRLDTTFGGDGKVVTNFGLKAVAYGVAMQSDGKILAAGNALVDDYVSHFALARYLPDGSPDPMFGDGGKVTSHVGGAYALAVQANGRIVLAGTAASEVIPDQAALALLRYMPDGTLDPSFGGDGIVLTDIADGAYGHAIAIQPDGKIVAAGESTELDQDFYDHNFALARYDRRGRLDPSFGDGGTVTTDLGDSDDIEGIVLQPDGAIVVAGRRGLPLPGFYDFALGRYTVNGDLDLTFGEGGIVITDFGNDSSAHDVGLQDDGKIIASGGKIGSGLALARYEPDGDLDPVFGTDGLVVGEFGVGAGMAFQPGARIVVVGVEHKDFALARYKA